MLTVTTAMNWNSVLIAMKFGVTVVAGAATTALGVIACNIVELCIKRPRN